MSRRELAAAGHDVGRAVRHLQHADRCRPSRRRAPRASRRTARARRRPRRRRAGASIGVVPAWLAMPLTSPTIAHAAVDRGDDAERQVELVQHRALLDVDFDEAEVVAPGRACSGGDRRRRRRQAGVLHRVAHRDAVGVVLVEPAPGRSGRSARPSRGRSPCSAGLLPRRSRRPRARTAGAGLARRSSRTQAIGTKMPSRPSYLPPLRTVS